MDRKFNWRVKLQNDNNLLLRYSNTDNYVIGFKYISYTTGVFTFTVYINDIFIETPATEQHSLDAIEKYCEDNFDKLVGMYNDIINEMNNINMNSFLKQYNLILNKVKIIETLPYSDLPNSDEYYINNLDFDERNVSVKYASINYSKNSFVTKINIDVFSKPIDEIKKYFYEKYLEKEERKRLVEQKEIEKKEKQERDLYYKLKEIYETNGN